ncbi:MAG TPA: hypothetical protein VGK67_34845 [Myxococcales bacterium]|jgi:hypothetical protein
MRPALAPLFACLIALILGCAPKLIPGTEIKDTSDTRAILDLVGTYKNNLEAKNVDGILKLVSKTFFENAGTPEGNDDYDYAGLEQKLRSWAGTTKAVRGAIEVKDIFVDVDKAVVRYFFDVSFQIPGPDDTMQWKRETDTKEMQLKREDGLWKITSGI